MVVFYVLVRIIWFIVLCVMSLWLSLFFLMLMSVSRLCGMFVCYRILVIMVV